MRIQTLRRGLVLLVLLTVACATTGSLRNSRGDGVSRFYEAPFDSVWAAARHAIEANGLRMDETSEYDRYLIATNVPQRGSGMDEERVTVEADQGERVAVFVDSVAPGTWGVEVVTRRTFALDPGKTSWAEDIFWVIERDLGRDARVDTAREAHPDTASGGG